MLARRLQGTPEAGCPAQTKAVNPSTLLFACTAVHFWYLQCLALADTGFCLYVVERLFIMVPHGKDVKML
jgi:hypothetical protein